MRQEIREILEKLAKEKYKEFNCKLIPGVPVGRVLGVSVPDVRSVAKRAAKGEFGDVGALLLEYESCGENPAGVGGTELFYEEVMLCGMVIGLAALELDQRMEYIARFVPRIDNWAICDVVSGDMKFANKKENREPVWDALQEYLHDGQPEQAAKGREYFIRFGVVMLLGHYIDEAHIDKALEELYSIDHPGYYVKMAVAWAISVCYIKFAEKTLPYIRENTIDGFTHNKSIQKIRESYRVSREDKDFLNTLKRK